MRRTFLCETFSLRCKLIEIQQNLIHANLRSCLDARVGTSRVQTHASHRENAGSDPGECM